MLSIALFSIFYYIKIPYSKLINYLGSCTLGIYMLHDGSLAGFLWKNVFKNATHQHSRVLVLYIICAVTIIFIVGCLIDSIRKVLEKVLIIGMDRICKFISVIHQQNV